MAESLLLANCSEEEVLPGICHVDRQRHACLGEAEVLVCQAHGESL